MSDGTEAERELVDQNVAGQDSVGTDLAQRGSGGPEVKEGEGMGMEGLAAKQRTAMETLVAGGSVTEAARSCGVSRTTIYQWLKHDATFQAAYNQWHEMMEQSCRSRLKMMLDKASSALEKALEGGDAKAALQLLKGMGMIRANEEEKSTVAEEVERENQIKRRSRAKLASDEMFADFGA